MFQSLFSGLLFKSVSKAGVFIRQLAGFNPFFQVFFLNLKYTDQQLTYQKQGFNPFFQVFFLNAPAAAELEAAEKFQSLFSGLLFKCVHYLYHCQVVTVSFNPFFQVFFLNSTIKWRMDQPLRMFQSLFSGLLFK